MKTRRTALIIAASAIIAASIGLCSCGREKGSGAQPDTTAQVSEPWIGNSKAVDIEPIEGIRITAPENTFDKDRDLKLSIVDNALIVNGVKDILEPEGFKTLFVMELDAGLKHDEHIPGSFTVTLDLNKMGIPENLYDRLAVCRVDEKANDYYRYQSRARNGKLVFQSNQNSSIVIVIKVLAGLWGLRKCSHAIQEFGMRKYFMGKDDNMEVPIEDENGDFKLYFRWKDTERPDGMAGFLKNEKEAMAIIDKLDKEAEQIMEKRANEKVAGKADLSWWERNVTYRSQRKEALKLIDKESILQELTQKDPDLARLNASPDSQLPESIQKVIEMVKLSNEFLTVNQKVKPLNHVLEVFLVDGTVMTDDGRAVKRVTGPAFLLVNGSNLISNGKYNGALKGGQSLIGTIAHELFHARQQTNYCTIKMGMIPAEATAGVLEVDATKFFYQKGFCQMDPTKPGGFEAYAFSPREKMYAFAKGYDELSVSSNYKLSDLMNPSRIWNKTVAELADASDLGYTMAYVIEAVREEVGKADWPMEKIVAQYTEFVSPMSKLIQKGLQISPDEFDRGYIHFCEKHMNTLFDAQNKLDMTDKDDQTFKDFWGTDIKFEPDKPVYEVNLKGNHLVKAFLIQNKSKSGRTFNVFVSPYLKDSQSPFIKFYIAGAGKLKNGKNTPTQYCKGENGYNAMAAVTSFSASGSNAADGRYYFAALYEPISPDIVKRTKDQIVFTIDKPSKELVDKGLLTGAVISYKPKNGKVITKDVTIDEAKKKITWDIPGVGNKDVTFTLSYHWYYKPDADTVYESPESDGSSKQGVEEEEEKVEIIESKPVTETDGPAYDGPEKRPVLTITKARLEVNPWGLIWDTPRNEYRTGVKGDAGGGFHADFDAEKGEISISYLGDGRWDVRLNTSGGNFAEGVENSCSTTASVHLIFEMSKGLTIKDRTQEHIDGTYSISRKKWIKTGNDWYEVNKGWQQLYCTDDATASGSFKDFTGWHSVSSTYTTQYSGPPTTYDFTDHFKQAVGKDLVPRTVTVSIADYQRVEAEIKRRLDAGERIAWENGRGYVVIYLDKVLERNGYGQN